MSRIISQLWGIITEILHLWRETAGFSAISVPFTSGCECKRDSAQPVINAAGVSIRRQTVNVPNL